MKTLVYKQLSQSAEGSKEAHTIMLNEVKSKIDALVESAPANNREKLSKMMDSAMEKIAALGNGDLFTFFANDDISTRNFICYINDILKGDL